jgi:glycosyltransferase involved in cell wall biosynthesis
LFLTQTDPNLIIPLLKNRGFADSDFFVGLVAPTEIPAYLHASDAGLSFVKAGYATQSRSPTKIPEYLACGLPIIANPGVGDVDSLILEDCVGVLVKDFTPESYLHALVEIERLSTRPEMAAICRASALKRFDLKSVGGERYRLLYNKLLGR